MKAVLYDKSGKKVAKGVELSDSIWDVPLNPDLVAQALYVYSHNQRKGTAHSKTRGEVRGGGKKPWRQKGTGRARHGSIRSPIWVGGGVAFGPRSYKAKKRLPRKMQHSAIRGLLSEMARAEKVSVIEDFSILKANKTKEMSDLLQKVGFEKNKVVVVVGGEERKDVLQASRNLENVLVKSPSDINVHDLVHGNAIFLAKDAIAAFEKRLK